MSLFGASRASSALRLSIQNVKAFRCYNGCFQAGHYLNGTPFATYQAFSSSGIAQAQQRSPPKTMGNSTRSAATRTPAATRPVATRTTATPTPTYQPTPPPPQDTSPPPSTERAATAEKPLASERSLTEGLDDEPTVLDENTKQVDWSRSFHGLSNSPFSSEAQKILLQPIPMDDIEIKPDGIIYLPEIKYRRILNQAFGPGGWGLAPRGETIVTGKNVTREYALVAGGRLVSIARGEQQYFDREGIPTATEGCKSNALMRCCKDLGIASELWDPRFIRKFMEKHSKEVWVEHVTTKKKRKITIRKDDKVRYPYQETRTTGSGL